MGGELTVGVLGPVEVRVDGSVVAITGERARRLLARLAAHPGAIVPRDVLIDELWPEELPGRPSDVLRVHISGLRRQLRDAVPDADGDPVVSGGGGWRLGTDPAAIDHVVFRALVDDARGHLRAQRWGAAEESAEAAGALWRGRPFSGLPISDDLGLVASELERLRTEATQILVTAGLELGRGAELVPQLRRLVDADRSDEDAALACAAALDQAGRRTEARDVLRASVGAVTSQGGSAGPGLLDELGRLERACATDDDTDEPVTGERSADGPDPAVVPDSGAPPDLRSTLQGRSRELSRVRGLLERHRTVSLLGLAGVGKTHLAVAVSRTLRRRTVWVPLDRAGDGADLATALARSIGWRPEAPADLLLRRATAELDRRATLVVLDHCDRRVDEVADLVDRLLARAPRCRILLTCDRPVAVDGVEVVVGPLGAGTFEEPGPAALIVADESGLDPGSPQDWDRIEQLVRAAGGLPLALRLVARTEAVGTAPRTRAPAAGAPTDVTTRAQRHSDELGTLGDVHELVAAPIVDALGLLAAPTVDRLRTLSPLPDGFSLELVEMLVCDRSEEGSPGLGLDAAHRLGLLNTERRAGRRRFRSPEPVRAVLRQDLAPDGRAGAAERLLATLGAAGRAAVPSWIEPVDRRRAALFDDEAANVTALLDQTAGDGGRPVDGVARLLHCWSRTGRHSETAAALGPLLDGTATTADPVDRAELLLAAATSSVSLAHKVHHIDDLHVVRAVARAEGADDMWIRATAELVAASGWAGDAVTANQLWTEMAPARRRLEHPWAILVMSTIEALLAVLDRRIPDAVDRLQHVAAEHERIGHPEEALAALAMAANLAVVVGHDREADRLLTRAADQPLDRFTGYGHATVAATIARRSMALDDPDAETRLRGALGILDQFGDHRAALLCRRDLGIRLLSEPPHSAGRAEAEELLGSTLPVLIMVDHRSTAVGLAAVALAFAHVRPAAARRATDIAGRLLAGTGAPLEPWERDLVRDHLGHDGGATGPPPGAAELVGVLDDLGLSCTAATSEQH